MQGKIKTIHTSRTIEIIRERCCASFDKEIIMSMGDTLEDLLALLTCKLEAADVKIATSWPSRQRLKNCRKPDFDTSSIRWSCDQDHQQQWHSCILFTTTSTGEWRHHEGEDIIRRAAGESCLVVMFQLSLTWASTAVSFFFFVFLSGRWIEQWLL